MTKNKENFVRADRALFATRYEEQRAQPAVEDVSIAAGA
jgi:hypothetical protein